MLPSESNGWTIVVARVGDFFVPKIGATPSHSEKTPASRLVTSRTVVANNAASFTSVRVLDGLYARRSQTVEPFNEWFKSLFELEDRVWHRGLKNKQTQLLAAIFACQLLVRCNHRKRCENGQIRWVIDSL